MKGYIFSIMIISIFKDFFLGGGTNPVYTLTCQRLVKTQSGRPKDAS